MRFPTNASEQHAIKSL